MKKIKLTLIAILVNTTLQIPAQNFQWDWLQKAPDNLSLAENVTDNANNTYVVGYISGSSTAVGTPTYNGNAGDGIILKYDTNGTLLWTASIGGSGSEICSGVSVDSLGNIYVTGYSSSTVVSVSSSNVTYAGGFGGFDFAMFISKFNSSGNLVYFKTVSHGDFNKVDSKIRIGSNIILLSDVIPYGCKTAFGTYSLTAKNDDAFIASFDLNANLNWVKFYSTNGNDNITDLIVQKNNDIYFTGATDGQSLVIGSNTLTCPSYHTYLGFIGKMGPTGNLKWLQTINNANVGYHYYMYNDYPIFNIAALNTNAICLAFSFSSNSLSIGTDTYSSQYYDCLIAQIDSMGNYIWSKTISGNQGTGLIDIAVNKNNYIYVLGVSSSTILSTSNYSIINSNPVSNLFFTAFDAQGQDYGLIMSRRTHTITNNYIEPYSISMDSNNNGYLVGYLNSDLICGTQSITSSPQNNFFLSKIKSSNALGIKNQVETSDDLNVYPNPAKSSINIDSRAFKNADIKIINTFGQVVYQKTKADLTESLDFSYLSAGIYFVNIQNKISQKTIKVIKE